jgi:hypothetical protein
MTKSDTLPDKEKAARNIGVRYLWLWLFPWAASECSPVSEWLSALMDSSLPLA